MSHIAEWYDWFLKKPLSSELDVQVLPILAAPGDVSLKMVLECGV